MYNSFDNIPSKMLPEYHIVLSHLDLVKPPIRIGDFTEYFQFT